MCDPGPTATRTTRRGPALRPYCVGRRRQDPDKQAFDGSTAAMYAQQAQRAGSCSRPIPQLIETAASGRRRWQGARLHQRRPLRRHGERPRGGNEGDATPTVRSRRGLPVLHADALVAKIKEIVGDMPGLTTRRPPSSRRRSGTRSVAPGSPGAPGVPAAPGAPEAPAPAAPVAPARPAPAAPGAPTP